MVRMGEASPYSSMASPNRYRAGCVSAFLNFFDWTPAKRFTHSTKRLTSGKQKPEKVYRRSRTDHNAPRKPSRMMCQTGANVAVLDHATRAPGVVARLMGLESLPQPYHRRTQSDTPILLQDLLKRDYKSRRKREESRLRKKSASLLTAFRCRPEVSCVSPAYIDSRFLCTVARSPARTSPFLSRLPQTPRDESPTARYELPEETIPQLSLRVTTAGSTVLLQGWPLESQRIVPPNIFEGEDEELDVMSTADSAPAMGSYTVAPGRRRGSGIEQEDLRQPGRVKRRVSRADEFVPSPGRHRSGSSSEFVFKTTRRPARSGGKLRDSCSRSATSQESAGSHVSSKTSVSLSKTGRVKSNPEVEDEPKRVSSSRSRSKETKPPLSKVRNQRADEKHSAKGADFASKRAADCTSKGAADCASEGASSRSGDMSSSYGVKFYGDRAPIHVKKRSGALDPSPDEVQDFGARLTQGNSADAATQSSAAKSEDSAMLRFKRKNKQHHARARSVDDVFPEIPLEYPKLINSPDMDFSTDCKQISGSPLVDFTTGECIVGRLNVSFKGVDYEEDSEEDNEKGDNEKGDNEKGDNEKGDYEELSGVFISKCLLVDCTEKLSSFGESGPLGSASCRGDERRICWEDEAAELGVCCSGPSVSSGSLPSDVEDSWSSCTESHPNRGTEYRSPGPLEIAKSTEVELEEVHQNLPPTQFVKKMVDAIVDEELAPQPSPVSIFDSPFLDEPCTPPEPILTGSIHRKLNSEDEELGPSVSTSDKLRQALLDISMFQGREDSCTTILATPSCEPKDERKFICGVLAAASFLGPSSPNWHDSDVAIDPSLFDELESGDTEFTCLQASGGLWRCDRRLLFDCVNEVLHHKKVEEGVVLCRPRGERLVAEVGKWIDGGRALASRAVDSLIEWDMGSRVGSWKRFGCEVEELGVEVESSVWADLLDEVVGDMVHVSRETLY